MTVGAAHQLQRASHSQERDAGFQTSTGATWNVVAPLSLDDSIAFDQHLLCTVIASVCYVAADL